MGITQPRKKLGNIIFQIPPLPLLRHSFAVNTLKAIKDEGLSPQYALPVLAAYMGHGHYSYTMVYLSRDASSRTRLYDFSVWQRGRM